MTTIDDNIPFPENVIPFPVKNIRYSMEGIPTDDKETISAVEGLKRSFFNKIAEDIVAYTSFIINNNFYREDETYKDPTIRDIIMLHESIVAVLCRMYSIDHPMHDIGMNEIEYIGETNDEFDLDNEALYVFKREKVEQEET